MTRTRREVVFGVAAAATGAGCSRLGLGRSSTDGSGGGEPTVVPPAEGEWPLAKVDTANSGHHPSATGPSGEPERAWRHEVEGAIPGPPTVAGGVVYAHARDGGVYAVSAADGTERWRRETGGQWPTAPAVVDGRVYVGGGETVYALHADDGSVAWEFDAGSEVRVSPMVTDGVVYAGAFDGTVYALDAAEGGEAWRYAAPNPVVVTPAVVGDTVYVSDYGAVSADDESGSVAALAAEDGSERWTASPDEGNLLGSPAVVDGRVVLGAQTGVLALDAADGSRVWHRSTGSGVHGSPAVADGTVYAGDEDGNVVALATEDGSERWHHEVSVGVYSPLAVVDDRVYVGDDLGAVTVLTTDGTVVGHVPAGDGGTAAAVVDGTLYVAGSGVLAAHTGLAEGTPTPRPA